MKSTIISKTQSWPFFFVYTILRCTCMYMPFQVPSGYCRRCCLRAGNLRKWWSFKKNLSNALRLQSSTLFGTIEHIGPFGVYIGQTSEQIGHKSGHCTYRYKTHWYPHSQQIILHHILMIAKEWKSSEKFSLTLKVTTGAKFPPRPHPPPQTKKK